MDLPLRPALPTPGTSFLGREAELEELGRLLAAPGQRLLTICGPGGIGKTRLALEAAARNASRYGDGVVFVALQTAESAEDLLAAVAEALSIPLTGASDPLGQLASALEAREALILLDNAEQVGDGVAVLSRLLAAAPGLTLLVTSREALELREEWLYPLGGLALADEAGEGGAALRLFAERARQARPGFMLDAERADALAICKLVEGMPLAIELAAAWARTLSCAAIAGEIRRGLGLLASGLRDIPARHRSVRAVCDQSWALLSPEERRAFARLAVFRSGFNSEAAATVAGVDLVLLDRLIGKSLVRRAAGGRYQIHELLRQYGQERLSQQADEAAEAAAALGQFYALALERWFTQSVGQGISAEVLAVMAGEIENVRAAWGAIVAQSDGERLRRAANIIQSFYFVRGPYHEGVACIEQALARLRGLPPSVEREIAAADCLNGLGWFRLRQGQFRAARGLFAESAAIYARLKTPRPAGDATDPVAGLGVVALAEGDYREAVRLGGAALQLGEAEGHLGNQGNGLYVLVGAAVAQGQYRLAQRYARRLYAVAEALGNRWFLAYCLIELGRIASGLGSYAEARGHFEAAYRLRETFADPEGMAVALAAQGRAALLAGEPHEAGSRFERSLTIYRHLGDQGGLASALEGLGRAQIALRAYGEAREALTQALRSATAMEYTPLQLTALLSVAELLLAAGRHAQGAAVVQLVARHPAADREASQRAHRLLLAQEAVEPPELLAEPGEELVAMIATALAALHTITQGDPPAQPRDVVAPGTREDLVEPLTEREREILGLIAAGRSNQEIADLLIFSVGTVKWYSSQIYGKLGVKSRTQAVARARALALLA